MAEFRRSQAATLASRLAEPLRFLQVVVGPRQVGKITLVQQVVTTGSMPHVFASGDEPTLRGGAWLEQQWHAERCAEKRRGEIQVSDVDQDARANGTPVDRAPKPGPRLNGSLDGIPGRNG